MSTTLPADSHTSQHDARVWCTAQSTGVREDAVGSLPEFVPHPFLRGGHAQTVFAHTFSGRTYPYRAKTHHVPLDDGDTIVLHDDVPPTWAPGDDVVVLLHGLSGCHGSPYVNRAAGRLNDVGLRTFRMDFRGCGAGAGLSRRPYHAGLSHDLRQVVEYLASTCAGSPISLVGYSMGGNLVLKLLGERNDHHRYRIASAVAVCPAVDLPESQVELRRFPTTFYDRYFTRRLVDQIGQYADHVELPWAQGGSPPRTLREFDEAVTARVWGFDNAERYYDAVSTAPLLEHIPVPTLVLAAADDPVVPVRSFDGLATSDAVRLMITSSGGHLGFIARNRVGTDKDRRWMDWRIVDWIAGHAAAAEQRIVVGRSG